jgi:hypothetical protein
VQHLVIEEEQRVQRLVLRRGRHAPAHSQIGEKCLDLRPAHLPRMPLAVEDDEAANPPEVSLLRPE